jgi:hypothetical protein
MSYGAQYGNFEKDDSSKPSGYAVLATPRSKRNRKDTRSKESPDDCVRGLDRLTPG